MMTRPRMALSLFFILGGRAAAQSPQAERPLIVLRNPQAPRDSKENALEALRADGSFSEEAGLALLQFLSGEKDQALRGHAAKVFYLLFYDSKRDPEGAKAFLLRPEVSGAIEHFLTADQEPAVRRNMAALGQIMLFGHEPGEAQALARAYLPILIRGLDDADAGQRSELIVALRNAKDLAPGAFGEASVRTGLERRFEREEDADIREDLRDLLARAPDLSKARAALAMDADRLFDGAIGGAAPPAVLDAVAQGAAYSVSPAGGAGSSPPLDLYAALGGNAVRPDERFHLQEGEPKPSVWQWGPLRRVSWSGLVNEDGSPGSFTSWSLGSWQLYYGSVKCDGSRTYALRSGQLGGTEEQKRMFVMTTTPKEKLAFRHHRVASAPSWDNMGGS